MGYFKIIKVSTTLTKPILSMTPLKLVQDEKQKLEVCIDRSIVFA